MSSYTSGVTSTTLRLTGLSSGLDTDAVVQQLMRAEYAKVDKIKQEKQLLEWKKEDYQTIINLLRNFQTTFFDYVNPSSNMRSSSNYKVFQASAVSTVGTNVVTATANSDAVAGTHTISVHSLAKAANTSSAGTVTGALTGTINLSDLNFSGKDFVIDLNGVKRTITLTGDYSESETPVQGLAEEIQAAVDKAFGAGRITVGYDETGKKISFNSPDGRLTLNTGKNDALSQLNIADGSSNRLNLSAKLNTINFSSGTLDGVLDFDINGVNFTFDTSKVSMSDVISTINSSSAGVVIAYSEVTDKFTITSKVMGAGTAITIKNNSGNLFGDNSVLKITDEEVSNGEDAVFTLDGVENIKRNSNSFTIDGVTYTLSSIGSATVTVTQDVDAVYNRIKAFVDEYNKVLETINNELSEERYRDYAPLTEDQKREMSDKEIELWEEKARSGMLKNDSILRNLVSSFRMALSEPTTAGALASIGITTGVWSEKGKLVIDENKLKEAIRNTPDKVAKIFSQESDIKYSANLDSTQRKTRYNENGIINRLYDILQDHIRTTRDSNNNKGLLIEKAGIKGDSSEFVNYLATQITAKDNLISDLLIRLTEKENAYYKKFTAMEKALAEMYSQQAWLSQQISALQA